MIQRASLFASLLLSLAALPAHAELHFAIPAGWVDLSPGKPVPAGVPEEIASFTQSGVYKVYAMDLAGAKKDGFAENLNVIVQPRPLVADDATLREFVTAIPGLVAREAPGATVKIIEQSVVPVAGVPSLRVVADIDASMAKMRTLEYLIPAGDSTAQVTYSSSPKEFARYLPLFEATVQQTQGAKAAGVGAQVGQKLLRTGISAHDWGVIFGTGGKLMGAGIGVLVAVALTNRARRRKAATS